MSGKGMFINKEFEKSVKEMELQSRINNDYLRTERARKLSELFTYAELDITRIALEKYADYVATEVESAMYAIGDNYVLIHKLQQNIRDIRLLALEFLI